MLLMGIEKQEMFTEGNDDQQYRIEDIADLSHNLSSRNLCRLLLSCAYEFPNLPLIVCLLTSTYHSVE